MCYDDFDNVRRSQTVPRKKRQTPAPEQEYYTLQRTGENHTHTHHTRTPVNAIHCVYTLIAGQVNVSELLRTVKELSYERQQALDEL